MDTEDRPRDPAGDPKGKRIDELLSLPLNDVHRFLTRKKVNPHDAWDIIQETMIYAYQNFDQHDQAKSLRSWVTGIALHKLSDLRRAKRVRLGLLGRPKKDKEPLTERSVERQWVLPEKRSPRRVLAEMVHPAADPLKQLLRKEAIKNLDDALERINPKYADAVILHHIIGYSFQEIADILGIPAGTVGSRVGRGLEELNGMLRLEDVEDIV